MMNQTKRPFRLVMFLFMGMAALFVVGILFLPEYAAWFILVWGLFCALLMLMSLVIIGLVLLLPSRVVWWWLYSEALPLLGVAAFSLLIISGRDTFLQTWPWSAYGVFALLAGWLLAGLVIASWGWLRYIRYHWRRC